MCSWFHMSFLPLFLPSVTLNPSLLHPSPTSSSFLVILLSSLLNSLHFTVANFSLASSLSTFYQSHSFCVYLSFTILLTRLFSLLRILMPRKLFGIVFYIVTLHSSWLWVWIILMVDLAIVANTGLSYWNAKRMSVFPLLLLESLHYHPMLGAGSSSGVWTLPGLHGYTVVAG